MWNFNFLLVSPLRQRIRSKRLQNFSQRQFNHCQIIVAPRAEHPLRRKFAQFGIRNFHSATWQLRQYLLAWNTDFICVARLPAGQWLQRFRQPVNHGLQADLHHFCCGWSRRSRLGGFSGFLSRRSRPRKRLSRWRLRRFVRSYRRRRLRLRQKIL
jgi:hypothetical protein